MYKEEKQSFEVTGTEIDKQAFRKYLLNKEKTSEIVISKWVGVQSSYKAYSLRDQEIVRFHAGPSGGSKASTVVYHSAFFSELFIY